MIREAGPDDSAALHALLNARIREAMFPLGNLQAHGLRLGEFPSSHPQASRFWRIGERSLVGLSQGGMLMPLLCADADLAGLRSALAGQRIEGAVGPSACVRRVLHGLDLSAWPTRKNSDEPALALDLAELVIPDRPGARLVRAGAEHRSLLLDWRAAYHRETLGTPAEEARTRAIFDVDSMIAQRRHRILLNEGRPVALTGFNAALPGIVQVGGVYVPPDRRGRGHARQAVALHLDEARTAGVARAVLFAASAAAARAYRALGFRRDGSFALVLFAAPATLGA